MTHLKKHFEYNSIIDLTAAHVGINKWQWECINNENEYEALKKMKEMRYDVLPIMQKNGEITKYFSTVKWNKYDQLSLKTIEPVDLIYYRLDFSDLVSKFNKEKKHYYFLTNGRDVLGLVSYVNLNCQAVYHYLFQVISDLEQNITYIFKKYLDQNEILNNFKKSSNIELNKVAFAFEKAVNEGKDSTIFEHMYLQSIGFTLKKFYHHLPERFQALAIYSSKFIPGGNFGEVRNKVMHPVRPILNDSDAILKIDELLKDYLIIKELLQE